MKGRFIVFEGIDGAGKTSAISYMLNRLKEKSIPAISTREPGGTLVGEKLRGIVKTEQLSVIEELLLMQAARLIHVRDVIKPALEDGVNVLCDRYTYSTYAYQVCGRECPIDIWELTSAALKDYLLQPDHVLFFDCPLNIALARSSNENFISNDNGEYQRIYNAYQQMHFQYGWKRFNTETFDDLNNQLDNYFWWVGL